MVTTHSTSGGLFVMSENLSGTVALVTGASSGIGRATAIALSNAGASVALVARRLDRLEQLRAEITDSGGDAAAFEADITSQDAANATVAAIVERFGRLDTVVNNAGVMLVGPFADAPDGEWDRMIDVNVRGVLYITRAALPHLVKAADEGPRRVADVVTISSTAGRVARPGTVVYNVTKFGVVAFSEALRQELQSKRVRVSVVEPGTVNTELASHTRDELRATIQAQADSIESLEPADIAGAVSYIVTQPRRVAVNEMLVRASAQTW
jgi:NADP-dependent 3-hydroxy acid dehydrogenase YdfG